VHEMEVQEVKLTDALVLLSALEADDARGLERYVTGSLARQSLDLHVDLVGDSTTPNCAKHADACDRPQPVRITMTFAND
jgi:hypothetical protein